MFTQILSRVAGLVPPADRLRRWAARVLPFVRQAASSTLFVGSLCLVLCLVPFAAPALSVFCFAGELPTTLSQAEILGGVRTAARICTVLYFVGLAVAGARHRYRESGAYVASILLLSVGLGL